MPDPALRGSRRAAIGRRIVRCFGFAGPTRGGASGEIRAAVFALVGSFAEIATYVRQRRIRRPRTEDETLLFEIVTGILDDGDNEFAPHGHTVRITVTP